MADAEALERLADAVMAGATVDWDEERARHPELAGSIDQLQALARVRAAHRSAFAEAGVDDGAAAGPADGAGPPEAPLAWGSLRLIERIGSGGFADVYRAHDPALQLDVALKLLRPAAADDAGQARRYLEEARRLARVRHPNVLVVHGAAEHQGRVGLWTELVRGATLEDLLRRQGPFGAREAALVGVDLCRALAAVHAIGLVHRDVKTTNVMREDGGRIVLMDFGAGVEHSPGAPAERRDAAVGTPLAMAPEQLAGETAGPPTDVYGLGVLLFRLVTGRYPIEARTHEELVERLRRGDRTPLRSLRPDLPGGFVQAVERSLESDPAHRHPDMAAMERAMAASLESRPRGSGRAGRRRAAAAAAAALLLAVTAALLWLRGVIPGGPRPAGPRLGEPAVISSAPGSLVPIDLLGIRQDDLLLTQGSHLILMRFIGDQAHALWQLDFPAAISSPEAWDVTGDGTPEIFVRWRTDDGDHVRVLDGEGGKLGEVVFRPLRPAHAEPWDGGFIPAGGVFADGRPGLVACVLTHYQRLPRGVGLWDVRTGRPVWFWESGSYPGSVALRPAAGAAGPAVVVATSSPGNGAAANGTDDLHCYVVGLDTRGRPLWQRPVMEDYAAADLAPPGFEPVPDSLVVVTTWSHRARNPEDGRVLLLSAADGGVRAEFSAPLQFGPPAAGRLAPGGEPRIAVGSSTGRLTLFDLALRPLRSLELGQPVRAWAFLDVDGDGRREIVASTPTSLLLLDGELRVLATRALPGAREDPARVALVRRGNERWAAAVSGERALLVELAAGR